ncbi:class I SAM-dependent methyltransferase [Scatolibacter rhodanostii]|uniref:class I SAM-dependent methyltransferase n=1 Tax=Scatolibacter rhodanostii TaxID=2014781 RepID=UPI000C075FA6|nr:class I SAM-dependent methyltransferase [Scatolibacter rhodanostii]
MEKIDEVFEFYNAGAEKGRLERGLGKVEFLRTKEILEKYLSDSSYVIYDIGGGIGVYSSWLAELKNDVHLLELAPLAVEYALKNQNGNHIFSAEICDARNVQRADNSADIVLLMGPLYHLQNKTDRLQVLHEAKRVLKKGGLLFSVGISKFSSTTWALSTYGKDNLFLDDDIYYQMITTELSSGIHTRPQEYPYFLAQAYFHTPLELQGEIESSGFEIIDKYAIEGAIWFTPCLNEKWEEDKSRERLLDIVRRTENEDAIMGMSPHFMIVSRK